MGLFFALLAVAFAVVGYIRLAPNNPNDWHETITATEPATFAGGAIRIVPNEGDTLARIHDITTALDRTEILAGSVEEGRVTYITRSYWMRFPDYTTVEAEEDVVKLYARLRFGSSDLGVNAARLDGIVAMLQR